jgi:hypothetical protein
MQECSAKYKAAQTAGTLKGMKWNDFRKAECGTDASATPAAATAPAAAPALPAKPTATTNPDLQYQPHQVTRCFRTLSRRNVPKYSSESAGKARMHTCLDQYNVTKTNNGNGSLVWIQKGGGCYSECNKRLKG